ncbi:hypothetical protein L195_g049911, partial [Trifolium pratense]
MFISHSAITPTSSVSVSHPLDSIVYAHIDKLIFFLSLQPSPFHLLRSTSYRKSASYSIVFPGMFLSSLWSRVFWITSRSTVSTHLTATAFRGSGFGFFCVCSSTSVL